MKNNQPWHDGYGPIVYLYRMDVYYIRLHDAYVWRYNALVDRVNLLCGRRAVQQLKLNLK